ncbi:MAG: hypothetical protein HRU41_41310 [Saprospiraceae bacterium]|nr:hypothetical protein [Saprospiraceae bacterium]
MCLMNVDADRGGLGGNGPTVPRRYQVKWAKSKKLLDGYMERYNETLPLRKQLRASHKALGQYLLYLYSRVVAKEQGYGDGVAAGQPLPVLRTNNVQLSKAMGCSERTIINLRERLKEAQIIVSERFRGSNASYELELSGAVIHIQEVGEPGNVVHLFPNTAQSLRHTVTRTKQVTNKLIELDGPVFQQVIDYQENEWRNTVENALNSCGKWNNDVENQELITLLDTQDTRAGYETVRYEQGTAPELRGTPQRKGRSGKWEEGQVGNRKLEIGRDLAREENGQVGRAKSEMRIVRDYAPCRLEDVLAVLNSEDAKAIRRHVTVIWTCALMNLYQDKWIADEEVERTKAVLAEYLVYAEPSRYQAGTAEILERIILVRRWIERGQKQGIHRWVPLPSRYFDYRNEKGFTKTKKWFKAHIKAKAEIKAKELLTKAIKEYLKSKTGGAKIGPSETYRRIAQRLSKYDQELLNQFHEQIAKVS